MHTLINRFPPEVLSNVLHHLECDRDLIVATHVCFYWRSTLISDPCLWTSLNFQSTHDIDRTLTYLERSKSATIESASIAFRHYLPSLGRLRLLLCKSTPLLRRLKMDSTNNYVPVPPFDNFLGQQAPRLRTAIFLCICPVLEFPFSLPSLTALQLRLDSTMEPLWVGSLFRLCSNCPQLETVQIQINCETIQDGSSDQVLSLDSLVTLDYTSSSPIKFLPFLNLPSLKWLSVSSAWKVSES